MDKQQNNFKQIHFHDQRQLHYGQNLYIAGNIPQLNNWNAKKAIKLHWYEGHHWKASIQVPKNFEGIIEYKFLEADGNLLNAKWDEGFNQRLIVYGPGYNNLSTFDKINYLYQGRSGSGNLDFLGAMQDGEEWCQKQQNSCPFPSKNYLKVMQFNIWHMIDERWSKRVKLILKAIEDEQVDFVGVQEVLPYQREYLKGNLDNYLYYGVRRSEQENDQEVGILYRKDKFFKLEGGPIWFSEKNNQPGYGSQVPRLLTWGLFQDLEIQDRRIGIISTQFDNFSKDSQLKSCEILNSFIPKLASSCEIVVGLGDFNSREDEGPLSKFVQNSELILSARNQYCPINNKEQKGKPQDMGQKSLITFHDYKGERCKELGKQIDHIFYNKNTEYQVYNFRVLDYIKRRSQQNKNIVAYPSSHYPVLTEFFKKDSAYSQNHQIKQDILQKRQLQNIEQNVNNGGSFDINKTDTVIETQYYSYKM